MSMPPSDSELIHQYARTGSQAAFSELVHRHVDLVYSAARRKIDSAHLAEEITQSVFLDLAKSAARLKPGTPLVAWLYVVTRRTAIDAIRQEARRKIREQTATEIAAMTSSEPPWKELEPLLDEALEKLSAKDRSALLLRFFENKNLRDVGEALGISDDAAQKRVTRATGQLRSIFARRGIAVGSGGLIAALSANATQAAPAALGATISTQVLASLTAPQAVLLHTSKTILMTTAQKALLATALALAGGFLLYDLQSKSTDHIATQTLQKEIDALRANNNHAAGELNATRQKIAAAKAELLQKAQASPAADPGAEAALEAWLERVKFLKDRLEKMPEKQIPELKFLTDADWLGAARSENLKTDWEIAEALGYLRACAKGSPQVAGNLQTAMLAYLKANNDRPPTDIMELKNYLATPLDEEILRHYETVASNDPVKRFGKQVIIRDQDVVIDEDADAHIFITRTGSGMQNISRNRDKVRAAADAYAKANQGQTPTEANQLIPYLSSPLDAARLEHYWQTVKGRKW